MLDWLASLRPGRGSTRRAEMVERFGAELDRPVGQLSRGNRQKLGLVQAFQHDPELVVLDEPTSGLDPLVQSEFQRLVRELVEDGRGVFLSSHSLDEVQRVADRVGIVREGRLVVEETVEALRARGLRRVTVTFAEPVGADVVGGFAAVAGVSDVHLDAEGDTLTLAVGGSFGPLLAHVATLDVVDLLSRPADLEEVFLAFYRGPGGGGAP